MIKSNFHTHTVFCDGKNTVEEMVVTAIDKGFVALGFSGHGPLELCSQWSMTEERQLAYQKAVMQAKEKYRNKIKIYCGIEQDVFSLKPAFTPEYVIGSAHRIKVKGEWLDVDQSAQNTKTFLKEIYDDNFDAYAKDYYQVATLSVESVNADVIGHIDLLTKFNEVLDLKLTDVYYEYAENAIKKLVKFGKPFEINTGAIGRGYRTSPYPDEKILKMIYNLGGKIMINTDCHNKDFLDCGLDLAEKLARRVGFTEHAVIGDKGVEYVKFE